MDFNAYVDKAIKSGIEAGKDQLIKQTLEEDHDYIMFKLHKIFGASYKHIENVLKKYNGDYATENEEVLNILANMMDDVEEAVTGKEVIKVSKEEEEDEPDRIMLEEVPVDNQKRITISWSTMNEAKLTKHNELYVLKSKEDDNMFYIVDEDFNYDTNRLEYIKSVFHYGFDALRMGIGSLLNVKYGDIVGVDVYDGQLVIYNTGSNVEDLTEDEMEEEPEEETEEVITNDPDQINKPTPIAELINQIYEKIKQDKFKKEPWFIRHYKITI